MRRSIQRNTHAKRHALARQDSPAPTQAREGRLAAQQHAPQGGSVGEEGLERDEEEEEEEAAWDVRGSKMQRKHARRRKQQQRAARQQARVPDRHQQRGVVASAPAGRRWPSGEAEEEEEEEEEEAARAGGKVSAPPQRAWPRGRSVDASDGSDDAGALGMRTVEERLKRLSLGYAAGEGVRKSADGGLAPSRGDGRCSASGRQREGGARPAGMRQLRGSAACAGGAPEVRPVVVAVLGEPNVGKSSTMNMLLGAHRVAVSSHPGRTKHYQTHYMTERFVLCDCPGLVFPRLDVALPLQVGRVGLLGTGTPAVRGLVRRWVAVG
jgi:hypothetical protein